MRTTSHCYLGALLHVWGDECRLKWSLPDSTLHVRGGERVGTIVPKLSCSSVYCADVPKGTDKVPSTHYGSSRHL